MNTKKQLNNILNKFPKVNLEKVELNSIKSIGKLASDYFNEADTAISKIKGLRGEAKGISNKLEQALKIAKKMESELPKLEKTAKDLGVNPDNINELGEAYIAIKDAQEVKKIINVLKKFYTTI
jgi:hypothetical protein